MHDSLLLGTTTMDESFVWMCVIAMATLPFFAILPRSIAGVAAIAGGGAWIVLAIACSQSGYTGIGGILLLTFFLGGPFWVILLSGKVFEGVSPPDGDNK